MKKTSMHEQQNTFFYVHFLGSSKSGKTTIINRMLGTQTKKGYKPTKILDPLHEKINHHNIYYYDTPGSIELMDEIQFLQLSNIIVLVYDVSDNESIKYLLENVIEMVEDEATADCKIVLCANKIELRESPSHNDFRFKLNNAVGKLSNQIHQFQVSCETGEGIESLHKFLKKQGINNGWNCLDDSKCDISKPSDSFVSRGSYDNNVKVDQVLRRKNSVFLKQSFAQKGQENVPVPGQKQFRIQAIEEQKGKQSGTIRGRNEQSNTFEIQNIESQVPTYCMTTKSAKQNKNMPLDIQIENQHYKSAILQNDQRKIQANMRKNRKMSQVAIQEREAMCGSVKSCQIM